MDIYMYIYIIAWFMCVNFVNDMAQRSQTLGHPGLWVEPMKVSLLDPHN